MEGSDDLSSHYSVFEGSSEQDVMSCKIFWNSVSLQPPLESRLVTGDMDQRLRAAASPRLQKNYAHELPIEDIQTEQLLYKAQKEEYLEQKAIYLERAQRREEIIALLKKQREDRIKKEAISLPFKPVVTEREQRSCPSHNDIEVLEDVKAVRQLQ
ncbi:Hypothetical predicted protein [Pelobates cultripes]|uniref:Cilia- and flagella-associated protein HOATZ n=1 Tax=Pelobates cultripes TaxID=61616 RepID=A0AAD1T9G6_PELCU|nr:Hypothetical predicted protein [Pelobates cultripes]